MPDSRLLPLCLLLGALLVGGADAQAVFTDATSAPVGVTGGLDTVTVQPGDTAFSLARRAGLSVADLLALNGLSSADLRVGQVLRLRVLPVTYAAQPGDTLYALARRFGVSVDALLAASALPAGTVLKVGQVLTLPAGTVVTPAVQAQSAPTRTPVAVPAAPGASPFQPLTPAQTAPVLQPVGPMPRPPSTGTPAGPPVTGSLAPTLVTPTLPVSAQTPLTGDWRTAALSLLNTPYVFGGATRTGTDCSGLVLQVFTPLGVTLPRTSAEQARAGQSVAPGALEAGDLVFFDTEGSGRVSHVGIYLGEDQFISANSYQGRVTVDRLRADRYWGPRFVGARRVLGVTALASGR